jgi:hypothetical protein
LIHIVCDNVSVHHGKEVKKWLEKHPRFQFHFTPVHCSWINQVEQWFSILQRKRLAIVDFAYDPPIENVEGLVYLREQFVTGRQRLLASAVRGRDLRGAVRRGGDLAAVLIPKHGGSSIHFTERTRRARAVPDTLGEHQGARMGQR